MSLDRSLDLASLAGAYAEGSLTPSRLMRDIHAAITTAGAAPTWISLAPPEQTLAAAALLESRHAAGEHLPLYGVPFAVKDNIDVAGLPTTAGCPGFAYAPAASAQCVRRLTDAGAIVIGKTNLDQFATGLTGTRSPYGACPNTFDARYISGGSSSGSAVAVARGQVSFALGTDTAGSGRVPAGFNNIVGLKPTRGLIGASGVVPACRSLDCVSIFALTAEDAGTVLECARGADPGDPWSRTGPAGEPCGPLTHARFGVPRKPEFFGDAAARGHYTRALAAIEATGATLVEIDYTPFRETARLLYEGPWVAERLAALGGFMERRPDALLPVTRSIIAGGARYSAVDCFNAAHRLQALKTECDAALAGLTALIVPTAPTIYRLDEVAAAPVELNTRLGWYTNFVNLLDYCALAVPAGLRSDGLPAGVTLIAPAFRESGLVTCAMHLQRTPDARLGATGRPLPPLPPSPPASTGRIVLAVVGAHLSGLPLNHQLTRLGAQWIATTRTAPAYRLYELPGAEPPKPGLVRAGNGHGAAIELELWSLAPAAFGAFVAAIPAPLGIGSVMLADGSLVKGFLCESYAVAGARDISDYGGWRRYLAAGKASLHGHAG